MSEERPQEFVDRFEAMLRLWANVFTDEQIEKMIDALGELLDTRRRQMLCVLDEPKRRVPHITPEEWIE